LLFGVSGCDGWGYDGFEAVVTHRYIDGIISYSGNQKAACFLLEKQKSSKERNEDRDNTLRNISLRRDVTITEWKNWLQQANLNKRNSFCSQTSAMI
jgi:hypothetical protein